MKSKLVSSATERYFHAEHHGIQCDQSPNYGCAAGPSPGQPRTPPLMALHHAAQECFAGRRESRRPLGAWPFHAFINGGAQAGIASRGAKLLETLCSTFDLARGKLGRAEPKLLGIAPHCTQIARI